MTPALRKAAAGSLAAALALAALLAWLLISRPSAEGWTPRRVVVPRGSNTAAVVRLLAAEGVVRHPFAFRLLVLVTRSGRNLHFGEYAFEEPTSAYEAWRKLVSGDVLRHEVTIPPGANLYDVAGLLAERGLASEEDFLAAARDRGTLKRLGIDAPSAEGYLFPETYRLVREQSPEEILETFHREFRRRFTPEMEAAARRQGYSVTKLLTIASIIEKETGVPREKPLVSAIIRRRLALGMPLQMDPTVIYGHRLFGKDITKRALRTESPYNTYTTPGLPPGPIANPGLDSIEAALNPAQTDYLYFVAGDGGTHVFSRTLEEHNRAVARYRALERARK